MQPPRCPTGGPRVRATIHPNKGGWPPHLPPGAAGRKTASAAVALDWHIPALLQPGADPTWPGHPPCGFRGTEERPIVTTRMWKNVFSNELFIIEIFIKTTPPSLRVKIFNSWRQTQPWYWVPGVRPLHEVNMRNRHSAEGLGAQFQVYSRMTFHDDFAMLQQYLQLLTFQGKQGTALGKESQLLSTKALSKGVPLSQGCRLWSAWIYSEKVHLLLLSVWRAQLWAYF